MGLFSWLTRFASRLANRRFIYTFTVLAVVTAKLAHIHSHRSAVAPSRLFTFFGTFFIQDIIVLLLIRLLFDPWFYPTAIVQLVTTGLAGLLIVYNVALSLISVTFYIVSGSEIHWTNIGLVSDPTSRAIFLSGLVTMMLVVSVLVAISWLLQNGCYEVFGWGAQIIAFPFAFAFRTIGRFLRKKNFYGLLPTREEVDIPEYSDADSVSSLEDTAEFGKSQTMYSRLSQRLRNTLGLRVQPSTVRRVLHGIPYITWCLVGLALLVLSIQRPNERSLSFLSWTTGLLPFVDMSSTSPLLDELPSHFTSIGIQHEWDERSAVAQPPKFNWLPKGEPLAGFEDWYNPDEMHYNAASDPMKISNLDHPLLEELRDKLKDVPVKHVMLFLLESTRNDVFPVKKDGGIWNKLQDSFSDHKIPQEAVQKLSTSTPTANYITGDYDDGFEHSEKPKRGGARFTNAYTSGTYTLKSLVGTICGITPLIADFNLDYKRHIYQPCLPQIFEAMNKAGSAAASKWKSYFFQTATIHYDNHHKLMAAMGYPEENTIDRDYLRGENATHGAVKLEEINYFGFQEDPLEDYIRDAFVDAEKTNGRVFLTHITSTSHHAYGIPANETKVELGTGKEVQELSDYVNAESYDDKWIRKVLNLLDVQGVANETLIVFLGDHGVSLVENGKASPYYNPSVGADHVPLIFSHPLLPAFDVHDAVHSTQVLPTILDLLLETGSVDGVSKQAAADLVRNYEGQSLLRPLQVTNNKTGQAQWQFTVVNPGRAMLNVRDARHPERHLSVPLIENLEWRLSDISVDPLEVNAVQAFDYGAFLDAVEERWGVEWAKWVEEGAFMTRWHVQDNGKRWRYERNPKVAETRDQ
ncbi:hypothetical protein FGRMN_2920 [Fusarium graminum]|nr:hypothetical protein FGRMN_2920 [Fusarium graminum]